MNVRYIVQVVYGKFGGSLRGKLVDEGVELEI